MSTSIESVSLIQTERVVVQTPTGRVIVTGQLGPKATASITGANDIDLSLLVDGATLVYSEQSEKWHATNLLEKQVMEGGQY